MSNSWKCCSRCRCPCKNNDLCPDTAQQLINEGNQSLSDRSFDSSGQSEGKSSPTLDDLQELERKVDQRLKNLPKVSKTSHSVDLDSNSDTNSTEFVNQVTERELQLNEILILRKRLQEAELRNAIIEEKVDRIERERHKTVSPQQINRLKQQILNFIEEKFSQLLQNL